MYATVHPRTGSTNEDILHTAVLTVAALIVGGFLIAVVLVGSMLLTGPLPTNGEGAPVPQMLPQPSAAAGLDR